MDIASTCPTPIFSQVPPQCLNVKCPRGQTKYIALLISGVGNGRIVVTVTFPEYLATSTCQKKGKLKGVGELESH